VERLQFAVSDLGSTKIFIGHEWLQCHNPSIDWRTSTLLFDRCPDECGYISSLSDLDGDPEVETSTTIPLAEGDKLYAFDIEGYLKIRTHATNLAIEAGKNKRLKPLNRQYLNTIMITKMCLTRRISINYQIKDPGIMQLKSLLDLNQSIVKSTP
jgi:hypothetical protein